MKDEKVGQSNIADEQELEHLTTSYQQLKQAQTKFKSCANDVNELTPESKGKLAPASKLMI